MYKWVEISDAVDDLRFLALEKFLKAAGIECEYTHSRLASDQDLRERLQEISGTHTQIRVGGEWRDRVKEAVDTWPATLLTLGSADALICDNHIWWARNFLADSVQILIAEQATGLDLTGSALLLGATPEARSAIHALVRAGICKFQISDRDETAARSLIEQLGRVYFNVKFEFVKSTMITQLPSATSVSINTRDHQSHLVELAELSYLNFLIPGGTWLDLSLGARAPSFDEEARTVGAQVINGWLAWARADLIWLTNTLEAGSEILRSLSAESLASVYEECYGSVQSS